MNNDMEKSLERTINGKYLHIYLIFAGSLCAACILGMVLIGIVAFEKNTWSYGLIILLFLSLVMAILAVISLVAFYREKGRCHERIADNEQLYRQIQTFLAENKELNKQLGTLQIEKGKLEVSKNELETQLGTLQIEKGKLEESKNELETQLKKVKGLFGEDWEDGYKETKNSIVKAFCEKVDSEFKVVKEKHKGELDKIMKNINNIDLNQIINQISNDGGASGSEPAEKAETSTKEESEKAVGGEDQTKTFDC